MYQSMQSLQNSNMGQPCSADEPSLPTRPMMEMVISHLIIYYLLGLLGTHTFNKKLTRDFASIQSIAGLNLRKNPISCDILLWKS